MTQLPKTPILVFSATMFALSLTGSLHGQSFVFGSSNDGLGGFTQSSTTTGESWTTNTGDVTYRSENTGTVNSIFARDFSSSITASDGYAYRIDATLNWSDGYADDNNRMMIYLFGDGTSTTGESMQFQFNTDDGSTGGSPGNNADDDVGLFNNFGGGALNGETNRVGTPVYSQDLVGTDITFQIDFAYVGADIEIDASMTAGGNTTTHTTLTVLASDYDGSFFGFSNRARSRNYAGPGGTPEGQSLP